MKELSSLRFAIQFYLENVTSLRKSAKSFKGEERWLNEFYYFLSSHGRFKSVTLISEITTVHLVLFQTYLQNRKGLRVRKLSAASINRRFNTIRHFLTTMVEYNVIQISPALRLKDLEEIENIRRPWSQFQFITVYELATPWMKDILIYTRWTAARAGSAASILWEHVNFEEGSLLIKTAKGRTGKVRAYQVPLFGQLKTVLEARLVHAKKIGKAKLKDHVFLDANENSVDAGHISKIVLRLVKKAGFEDARISHHGLRHSLATDLNRSGASTDTIRRYLGHTNVKTTMRYIHGDMRDMKESIEKVFDSDGRYKLKR